jgi:PAS domain S-box-containing protein
VGDIQGPEKQVSADSDNEEPQDLASAVAEIEHVRDSEAKLRRVNASLEAEVERGAASANRALAQLRDSERHFKLLVQSVTDYAIYMLGPDGIVASWNAGAEHIKGYKPHEIMGRNYAEFFTPEDRAAGVPQAALKTAAKFGRYESEGWRLRKDGSRFWSLAVIDAVRDEQGELLGFAKITRDMTERREAQIRLERAQEKLAESQKMEAIGQLTGGIAHDFNNLLMIVSGQAQLMKKRVRDPKDIRSIEAIEQAAQSGANLTRQLLTFARRQRLTRVSVMLEERLATFRDLLESSVGGMVRLQIDIPEGTWPVEADVGELELALVNIAVNARDAMPDGGTLSIAARNETLDGHGVTLLEGDFVALSLRDTGTGIKPDVLSRVFEPFFTTKDIGKGTGLGLSQVYGFARQSGGDVHISSREGEGTAITLFLPRAGHGAAALAAKAGESEELRGSGTILVVEDNPQVGDVSALMLEQLGYKVLRVDRPDAALALLDGPNDVNVVFTDIVMPGDMDGLALARTIQERYAGLPVLLATGYSSAAERAAAEFPVLRKPYDQAMLALAVKAAFAGTNFRQPRNA